MALGTPWLMDIALAAASIAILVGLLYVYVTNYRQARSPFSLGLVVFAVLFIIENIAGVYFYIAMSANEGPNVAMPMLAMSTAELVGFSTLFYISWR